MKIEIPPFPACLASLAPKLSRIWGEAQNEGIPIVWTIRRLIYGAPYGTVQNLGRGSASKLLKRKPGIQTRVSLEFRKALKVYFGLEKVVLSPKNGVKIKLYY